MTWHLDPELLARYRDGGLGETASYSVESHLVGCDPCRRLMFDAVEPIRQERVWERVVELVERPSARPAERILGLLGVPDHTARLLAMTPSIRVSWVVSVLTVLILVLVASQSFGGGPILFLAVAPLVPVAGIVVSFGRSIDPLYEMGLATPTGGFRLMLIRALAVLASSVAVSLVPALFLAELRWMVVWLLPSLVVTMLTLIISSVTPVAVAGGVASALWLAGVAAVELSASTRYAAFRPGAQFAFAGLALALIALLLVRRQAFEHLGHNWRKT